MISVDRVFSVFAKNAKNDVFRVFWGIWSLFRFLGWGSGSKIHGVVSKNDPFFDHFWCQFWSGTLAV